MQLNSHGDLRLDVKFVSHTRCQTENTQHSHYKSLILFLYLSSLENISNKTVEPNKVDQLGINDHNLIITFPS